MTGQNTKAAFIGIDIGTSSVKALLSNDDGQVLDSFAAGNAMQRPRPGYAEQDPQDWMGLVEQALVQFGASPHASGVQAIGITSQVNTHVFCDADQQPLGNAITWQDTRSARQAGALDGQLTVEQKIKALGAPIPIDASHALSRMAWMRDHMPDVWTRTAHVFAPKDYVIAQLTGAASADPLASVGLVGTDFVYADAVLSLLPGAQKVLPKLNDPLAITGTVAKDRPFAGVPVSQGTMDAWAAMFGLGVSQEGQAMYLSGTSEVLGLIAQERAGTQGIVVFPDWRGITLHAAPTQAGGASLAWLSKLLGRSIPELSDIAAKATIRADSPLFLPHLEGERAPLWDPASRGGFAGLTTATKPEELAACVMEGVAFSARLGIQALEESGKQRITTLRHGGGGAASDVWCQIRANALGRRLERVSVGEAGAAGAIAMASVASGHKPSLARATSALTSIERAFEPEAETTVIAEKRFAAYRDLYGALRPVTDQLRPI